ISDELVAKVIAAAGARLKQLEPPTAPATLREASSPARGEVDIVLIGVSTGGPQALKYLIPQFPADFPVPVAIVLHMPPGYTDLFAQSLDSRSLLKVREAQGGEELQPGIVLLAPGGYHLKFQRRKRGEV